ncbi:hypothetical protein L2Y94_05530 [Luteibacter aegosomatis]|uniref:hypothetical protein n=1 Tax=Luteibacter aegosomatis TaxID=2911537 RepID=UPI001FF7FBFE|nr:hypothetical protein [Luteibacter aegosomatis]UPG86816.1 hypothetical protein L2Y94_05530 [Luteibacter aegosomatis]
MPFVTVKVEIDASEVIDQLDEDDLSGLGLVDVQTLDADPEATDWQPIADALRRADFRRAEELMTEAARVSGVDLPPFAVARVA